MHKVSTCWNFFQHLLVNISAEGHIYLPQLLGHSRKKFNFSSVSAKKIKTGSKDITLINGAFYCKYKFIMRFEKVLKLKWAFQLYQNIFEA